VTGGVGFTRFYPESGPNNNALNANGGLGVKLFTWRTMGFRFDVRYFYLGNGPFNTSVKMHNLEATVGFFALLFAPAPPPKDKDNDGLNDDVDKCPNEPEDKDGFEDNDGCPDLDNDKDGVPDEKDKCPNEPEDKDNFQDDDGCPDLDNDADGISDANDKCPDEAEDKDGFQDDDGCPDPDNDNDKVCDPWVSEKGLLDKYKEVCQGADKCPEEAETENGFQDDDGCADQTRAKIVGKKIEISETILFKSGTDQILPESFGVLNDVLSILKSHTEIKKVSIEGHTDTRGSATSNKKLSQKRADAVKKYLSDNGVAPELLQSVGYGEDMPIVPKEKT
jgi:outer membrane protein OmpA-like peptidoglycan-associated protein